MAKRTASGQLGFSPRRPAREWTSSESETEAVLQQPGRFYPSDSEAGSETEGRPDGGRKLTSGDEEESDPGTGPTRASARQSQSKVGPWVRLSRADPTPLLASVASRDVSVPQGPVLTLVAESAEFLNAPFSGITARRLPPSLVSFCGRSSGIGFVCRSDSSKPASRPLEQGLCARAGEKGTFLA